jgi:hypothetical protein
LQLNPAPTASSHLGYAEPPDPTEKTWYTAAEAAAYLGYKDPKTVRRAHLDGRLQGRRTAPTAPGSRGGNLKFHREWLDRFAQGYPPLNAPHARRAAS